MREGIDTATPLTATTAGQIAGDGKTFVLRYLAPDKPTYRWKRLTLAEAQGISASGLDIGAVYETSANRPKGGAENGTYDGAQALLHAQELGMPQTACIYFAVDYDAPASDFPAIEAYLRAAKGQLAGHPIGVYGSFGVIEAMAERGAADYFWQCLAWSRGKVSARAALYQRSATTQYMGIGVDFDTQHHDDAGLWNYREDDDMTGEEIYTKLTEYCRAQTEAPGWAKAEFQQAIDMGITDGTRPMELIPRYQAAIMAKRAAEK